MEVMDILDRIGKNLNRIKTIGIVIIIVLFGISLINNGCNRSEMNSIVEKVTGLNVENDLLHGSIKDRDSLITAHKDSINMLESKLFLSKGREKKLESKNAFLRRNLNDISNELLKIPYDSSYSFLNKVAYPYAGLKEYSFSGVQTKAIHRTYLEHQGLIALNDNLQEQRKELYTQIHLQDSLSYNTMASMSLMKTNRQDLEQVIDNKDEEIELKDKQLKKAKRKDTWKIIGVGVGALILGFLAGS